MGYFLEKLADGMDDFIRQIESGELANSVQAKINEEQKAVRGIGRNLENYGRNLRNTSLLTKGLMATGIVGIPAGAIYGAYKVLDKYRPKRRKKAS